MEWLKYKLTQFESFQGKMACLQIYDVALTQMEIENNRQCPVGMWQFQICGNIDYNNVILIVINMMKSE